jgi:hypothetical protein
MIALLLREWRLWRERRKRDAALARINAEIAERRRKHKPCRDLIRKRVEITHADLLRRHV